MTATQLARHSRRALYALMLMLGSLFFLVTSAQAQLRVDISGVGATQYPIAIANFENTPSAVNIAEVIRADLTRTGQFQLVSASSARLNIDSEVDASYWRNRGADYLAFGSVDDQGGQYTIRYRLIDTVSDREIDAVAFAGTEKELRRLAHRIADRIYEAITGQRGVFSTKIAYVLHTGDTYELQIADADGQNPQVMLRSKQPIISPAWSPDGNRIAYVSFELEKPVVYVQNLSTAERNPVANFKGNNSAPAWSPDGNQLAIALSKDGISQIYTINADGSDLRRVMRSPLIDTEPHFSPDGKWILFTSDRGGSPQIYRVPVGGGEAQRVTFNGGYNISPQVAPDGQSLAYVTRRDGAFRIATLDMDNDRELLLTSGPDDQSPSFAPNGQQILYSTVQGGKSVLAVTSVDGRVTQTLSALNGTVREPTWGPFTD